MALEPVVISGLTAADIKKLFDQMIEENYKAQKGRVSVLAWDVSYLYSFDKSDFDYMAKLGKLARYSFANAHEWWRMCERFMQNQTVRDDRGMIFKPQQILRSVDKVPNEGLEFLAKAFCGGPEMDFNFHALGKGVGLTQAYASDTFMADEIERINVWATPGGGSLYAENATIIAIGNHTIDMEGEGEPVTESGLFNTSDKSRDHMGDHSIFPTGIPHFQGETAIGSATVIYLCSV